MDCTAVVRCLETTFKTAHGTFQYLMWCMQQWSVTQPSIMCCTTCQNPSFQQCDQLPCAKFICNLKTSRNSCNTEENYWKDIVLKEMSVTEWQPTIVKPAVYQVESSAHNRTQSVTTCTKCWVHITNSLDANEHSSMVQYDTHAASRLELLKTIVTWHLVSYFPTVTNGHRVNGE